MSLRDKFKKAIDKGNLGVKKNYIPFYRTGIDIFDYINGIRRYDGSLALGIMGGRIIMDVGNSGSGKTSVLIGQACYIADQYEDCDVWHYDYERSTSPERVMAISGWDYDRFEEKYHLFNSELSVETIYTACKEIEKIKMECKEEIQIDTGKKDSNGNPIYELPPTIMLVDSVALLAPKEVEDDDELKGSMGASAIAKANTNVFKRILAPLENANIILMLVNHLNQKIDIGPIKSQAQVNYLGQDETIPGGRFITYSTNTLTKLKCASKIEPDKEFGVKGYYLTGIVVKSRNTEAGVQFKMVFEQKIGINNLLTNFVNLKEMGRITGAGRSYKLDTCPDIKFSMKEFQKKYNENPELKEAFDKAVHEEYSKFIPDNSKDAPNNLIDVDEYELIDEDNEVYKKDGKYYQLEDNEYVEVEYEE
jgi:RecA/RadA recombinase